MRIIEEREDGSCLVEIPIRNIDYLKLKAISRITGKSIDEIMQQCISKIELKSKIEET